MAAAATAADPEAGDGRAMMSQNKMGDIRVVMLKTTDAGAVARRRVLPWRAEELGPELHDQRGAGADRPAGREPGLGRASRTPSSGSIRKTGSGACTWRRVLPFVDEQDARRTSTTSRRRSINRKADPMTCAAAPNSAPPRMPCRKPRRDDQGKCHENDWRAHFGHCAGSRLASPSAVLSPLPRMPSTRPTKARSCSASTAISSSAATTRPARTATSWTRHDVERSQAEGDDAPLSRGDDPRRRPDRDQLHRHARRPPWAGARLPARRLRGLRCRPARPRPLGQFEDSYGGVTRNATARIEQRFTAPQDFKLWPQAERHTQWPGTGRKGDPVFDQFYASQVRASATAMRSKR